MRRPRRLGGKKGDNEATASTVLHTLPHSCAPRRLSHARSAIPRAPKNGLPLGRVPIDWWPNGMAFFVTHSFPLGPSLLTAPCSSVSRQERRLRERRWSERAGGRCLSCAGGGVGVMGQTQDICHNDDRAADPQRRSTNAIRRKEKSVGGRVRKSHCPFLS